MYVDVYIFVSILMCLRVYNLELHIGYLMSFCSVLFCIIWSSRTIEKPDSNSLFSSTKFGNEADFRYINLRFYEYISSINV